MKASLLRRVLFIIGILVATVGALALRGPRLDERPMHTDESVHTAKAGILIETGEYTYDPHEYHGPTIYYFALPFVWASGAHTLADTSEWMFRIVPVVFGVGLVLLLLLMGDGLGRWAAFCAAVLTAVSPAMVFYSRYYIQEMLLVFFTFGALASGWRYTQSRRIGWALLCGACLGMMAATKETCIIAYAAMVGALVLTVFWGRWRDGVAIPLRASVKVWHLILGAVMAAVIAVVFITGFFTNPRGALDLFLTYGNYFERAGGVGIHDHPWYYYIKMLIYTKNAPGPWWSEGLIVGLALVGIVGVMLRRPDSDGRNGRIGIGVLGLNVDLGRFLAFYTVLLAVGYAVIPYKTPWCALGFLHGMILLAGVGAVVLLTWLRFVPARVVVAVVLVCAAFQLGQQAYRANGVYAADTRNPYVYGHTSTDVLRLAQRLDDLSKVSPDGKDLLVKVVTPGSDCWPLPWYLRRFGRVGYWSAPLYDCDAPVVVVSQELQEEVEKRLRGDYQTEYYGLRPDVLIAVYIRRDLWDAFMRTRM